MADHGSVFKRVEKKYRLAPQQRSAIEVAALERMSVDCYGRSLITSLYLDTPARDMIARSVEKPLYKEKLRLRAYGPDASHALMHAFCDKPLSRAGDKPPLSDAEVSERCAAACADEAPGASEVPIFFEIKKKFKGVVYKRRLVLSLPAALAFASGLSFEQAHLRWPLAKEDGTVATPSKQERQIARELEAAMDRWGEIAPSMGIACWREAWALREHAVEDAFDPKLRITFDDALQCYDCLAERPAWTSIIGSDETIMEIKSAGPYAPWLVEALSAERIHPASFTKYGTAYELCAKKGASICSTQASPRSSAVLTR